MSIYHSQTCIMWEEEFRRLLVSATEQAKTLAMKYVKNSLPANNIYTLRLSLSNDALSLTQFDMYPEDQGKVLELINADMVVETLLRNGKVPVWIDISVTAVRKRSTILTLLCAGRYSDDTNELYYHEQGNGSFGVKSPNLPINYKKGEKFWLPGTRKWFP